MLVPVHVQTVFHTQYSYLCSTLVLFKLNRFGSNSLLVVFTDSGCYYLGLISNLMHKILIYLHIIHLLKSSTCFEHYPAHLQEVYVVILYKYMQPLVSSLS